MQAPPQVQLDIDLRKLHWYIHCMKTAKILRELNELKASNQTLQPRAILDRLIDLAQVVAELEDNVPGRNATDELLDDPN